MNSKTPGKTNKQKTKEELIAEFKQNALEERGHAITDEEAKAEIEMLDLVAKIFVQQVLKEDRDKNLYDSNDTALQLQKQTKKYTLDPKP
jgi:hypothetical protein